MSNRGLIERLKEAASNAPNHAILRDSASALEASEWRDIEDMPEDFKDGREILVFTDKTGEMFVVFYAHNIWGDECSDWVISQAKDGTCFILKDPTHWMPLPSPPQTGERK